MGCGFRKLLFSHSFYLFNYYNDLFQILQTKQTRDNLKTSEEEFSEFIDRVWLFIMEGVNMNDGSYILGDVGQFEAKHSSTPTFCPVPIVPSSSAVIISVTGNHSINKAADSSSQVCASNTWTLDMESSLIDEVEARRYLWDTNDPLFLKRCLKRTGYIEIAKKLKKAYPAQAHLFSYDNLLHKFANMRTYHRRWSRLLKDSKHHDRSLVKWRHFKRLNFLKTSGSDEEDPGNETNDESSNASEDTMRSENSSLLLPDREKEDEPPSQNDFPRHDPVEPVATQRKNPKHAHSMKIENVYSLAAEDADVAFGKYVAASLKTIPDLSMKDIARMRIIQAILECREECKQNKK